MSQVPEFHFDFGAVQGMPFEEGAEQLFRQLESHYNTHIQPKPYIFGADPAKPGADRSVETVITPPAPTVSHENVLRMKDDYEIKEGKDLGLKAGNVLTGVTEDGIEVFDFLKNYTPGDQIVEGDSGKYDLGRKS